MVGVGAVLVAAPVLAQRCRTSASRASAAAGRSPRACTTQGGRTELGPRVRPARDPAHPFPLNGYKPDALPKNYKPLPRDIFTSPDFYADKALWSDPRYFRCNSPHGDRVATRNSAATAVNSGEERCPVGPLRDRDYPREAIVSPYRLQDRAGALRGAAEGDAEAAAARTRTRTELPGVEWNGVYERPARAGPSNNWYWGANADPDDPVAAEAGVPDSAWCRRSITRCAATRSGPRRSAGPKASCGAGTRAPSGSTT